MAGENMDVVSKEAGAPDKKDEIQKIAKSARKAQMEQDFSSTVDVELPKFKKLAEEGNLTDAVQNLLALEKQTRNGGDIASTSRIAVGIVQICRQAEAWDALYANLTLLSKRRSQEKKVITDMVQCASKIVDELVDPAQVEKRLKLIETLRDISAGKIFLEIERARLTRTLAYMKETDGDVTKAAMILHELQVETFGAMEKKEKTEFILEQMRLCLANNDFIRAQMLSRKINKKVFAEADLEELKFKFYNLMIQYHKNKNDYVEICKCYVEMYNTESVKSNPTARQPYLKAAALFICLSVYSNESSDLMNRLFADKHYDDLNMYKSLMKHFLTPELICWDRFQKLYAEEIATNTSIVSEPTFWEDVKKRHVEHNLRVIARYYSRISMPRLSKLLNQTVEMTEELVTRLVNAGMVVAKMDRPGGVVCFMSTPAPNATLTNWSADMKSLLTLIERTSHLIHRENLKLGPLAK